MPTTASTTDVYKRQILMGGVSAFALSPALPDEPAPAELSVTNAVSEAQLRSALSKLTVTYDSEAEGWQIDSPYEEASMEKASCGLYPYLFVTNDDPTVYLSLGMTYFGNKKLDMKSVRVETEDNYYDFTCDEAVSYTHLPPPAPRSHISAGQNRASPAP